MPECGPLHNEEYDKDNFSWVKPAAGSDKKDDDKDKDKEQPAGSKE
jgi:hypothetical protein